MLRITRGATYVPLTFPAELDLTGCTVYFTVKPTSNVNELDPEDSNAVVEGELLVAAPPAGNRVLVPLTYHDGATPGEDYVFDVWLKDSGGTPHPWVDEPQSCQIVAAVTQDTA